MIYSQIMSLNPRERAGLHPSGPPRPTTASRYFWLLPVLSLTGYQKFISLGQN